MTPGLSRVRPFTPKPPRRQIRSRRRRHPPPSAAPNLRSPTPPCSRSSAPISPPPPSPGKATARSTGGSISSPATRVGRNRVLRLRREHRLLSPHRAASAPAKAHDGRITTDAPNVRWATDGSKIWTPDDGWVWLFELVEHWNGECRGWHACKIGDRFAAWEPLAQALAGTLAGVPGAARGIELRHDHGSQYLSDFFQSNARHHGFAPSFALLGEPQTNGVVERFHRTLKEQVIHGRTYQNLAQLRAALAVFVHQYNHHWRLEKLRYQWV